MRSRWMRRRAERWAERRAKEALDAMAANLIWLSDDPVRRWAVRRERELRREAYRRHVAEPPVIRAEIYRSGERLNLAVTGEVGTVVMRDVPSLPEALDDLSWWALRHAALRRTGAA